MGLNLKDEATVALVAEVARRLGTSKTGAVRELARQKLAELDNNEAAASVEKRDALLSFLVSDIWPKTAGVSLSKPEIEALLGYDELVPE